ncbi:unnamed protein product, partial [Staurois parvus]
GPAASGICHVTQVPPYHSQKAPLPAHAHLAPGCHAHTTEAGKTAPLDRGTGKMKEQLHGSGSGYLSNSGTRSPSLPKGQQSSL